MNMEYFLVGLKLVSLTALTVIGFSLYGTGIGVLLTVLTLLQTYVLYNSLVNKKIVK